MRIWESQMRFEDMNLHVETFASLGSKIQSSGPKKPHFRFVGFSAFFKPATIYVDLQVD